MYDTIDYLPNSQNAGFSVDWDKLHEVADNAYDVADQYAKAQAQNATSSAAYNAATVAAINQDTENKRVMISYISKAIFFIVIGILGVVLIKTFKSK